eukprot:15321445-Alexandrium_andersonii.AAC.1
MLTSWPQGDNRLRARHTWPSAPRKLRRVGQSSASSDGDGAAAPFMKSGTPKSSPLCPQAPSTGLA